MAPKESWKTAGNLKVTEDHWYLLTQTQLSWWCEEYDLPKYGSKSQMIERLMGKRIVYDTLDSVALKDMCMGLGLPSSGSNADRVARLTGSCKTTGGQAKPKDGKIKGRPAPPGTVAEEHLDCLTAAMLSELCELEEIQKSGKKAELVERLMEEGIKYEQLQNKYLKEMCDRSGLDCSGAKAELIARLTAGQAGNKEKKSYSSKEEEEEEEEASMSNKQKPMATKPKPAQPSQPNKPTTKPAQQAARKSKIVALCIGVSAYKDEALKLKNAAKDARDLAAALRSQGVDVTLLQDPDVNQLRHGVQEFCHDKITKQTPLAIFFYAGHGGLCVGTSDVLAGKHIMMAKCWQDYDINKGGFARAAENHGYPIETVVSSMQRSCALNLVIVDACRSPARGMRSAAAEEESSRAWGSAKLEGGRNTLICNACKSLHTASDGVAGKNGLYTEALLKHMFNKEHPHLFRAINNANKEVYNNSYGKQQPSMEVMDAEPFEKICLA